MTPDPVKLARFTEWLHQNQPALAAHYRDGIGHEVTNVDLYAAVDGVHVYVEMSNGFAFDTLVPGVTTDPEENAMNFAKGLE